MVVDDEIYNLQAMKFQLKIAFKNIGVDEDIVNLYVDTAVDGREMVNKFEDLC